MAYLKVRRSINNKIELGFCFKMHLLYCLKTAEFVVENPNFLICQFLPLLNFKRYKKNPIYFCIP